MISSIISTALVISNAIVIMALLLNVRPRQLPACKRICFLAGAVGIVLLQAVLMLLLDVHTYAKLYVLVAQLPAMLLFYVVAGHGFAKTLFVTLTTIFLSSPGMLASKLCGEVLHLPHIGTLVVVLIVVVQKISELFMLIKDLFQL